MLRKGLVEIFKWEQIIVVQEFSLGWEEDIYEENKKVDNFESLNLKDTLELELEGGKIIHEREILLSLKGSKDMRKEHIRVFFFIEDIRVYLSYIDPSNENRRTIIDNKTNMTSNIRKNLGYFFLRASMRILF